MNNRRLISVPQVLVSLTLVGFIASATFFKGNMSIALLFAALSSGLIVLLTTVFRVHFQKPKGEHAPSSISESKLHSIVAASPDSVLLINEHGNILHFNPQTEIQFGYGLEEAKGRNMLDLMFPEERVEPSTIAIRNFISTGSETQTFNGQIQLVARKNTGENFPVVLSISPIVDRTHKSFVVYTRDIAKQLAAEVELMQARDRALENERAKSRFIAVMSHEMRTPLNGLLGTLDLLSGTSLTVKQEQYLSIATKSGRLLLEHVNDVLDISKIEAGKSEVERLVFNPQDIINDVYEGQLSISRARKNTLCIGRSNLDLGTVVGDPAAVRQILLNLVSNANKFTTDGDILIEAEDIEDDLGTIEFRVTDTGIGIARDSLQDIFLDFVTLDPNFDREAEGTGLGLPITKRLTEAMGGEIGVESEQGEGSLFWVRIPFGAQTEKDQNPIMRTEEPLADKEITGVQPLQILLVEDNEINRFVAREMLEADGHIVTEASDGEAGAAAARKRHFDVILMDISMPKLDGVSATKLIRNSSPPFSQTPIVALTAHALPANIARFQSAGMNHFLTKPVTQEQLRSVLAKSINLGPRCGNRGSERTAPPNPPELVNQDILFQLVEILGQTRVDDLLKRFLDQAESAITEFLQIKHPQQVQPSIPQVHRLAGSAATFGAHRLREALCNLEEKGKAGETEDFMRALPNLPIVLKKSATALHDTLKLWSP